MFHSLGSGPRELVRSVDLSRQHHPQLIMISAWMMGVIATLACAASAFGQGNSNYREVPINQRYRMQSTGPILKQERNESFFEERTEDQIKKINSSNRSAKSAISADSKKVEDILEDGGDLSDPVVKQFLNGYIFPRMTQTEPEHISQLGTYRSEFFKDFLNRKVTGQNRSTFIDTIVLPSTRSIHRNAQYHPAVRLNALYLIGMIDSQAADRTGNRVPIPSESAFDELLQVFSAGDTPAYLKVAALAGLYRHAQIDQIVGGQIADDKKRTLIQQLEQITSGQANGQADWDPQLSYWLKRRAIQTLGLTQNPSSLDPLLKSLKQKDASEWLRFDAMQAIGRLDLSGAPAPKIKETTIAVTEFVADSLASESQWIRAEIDELVYENILLEDLDLVMTGTQWGTDETGGFGLEDPGMMMSPEDELGDFGAFDAPRGQRGGRFGEEEIRPVVDLPTYQLNVIRRRIKAVAFHGNVVLKNQNRGLYARADDETKTMIDQVTQDLQRLLVQSNLGIVNLDEVPDFPEEEQQQQSSIAKELAQLSEDFANRLERSLSGLRGDADPEPGFDPGAEQPPATAASEPASQPSGGQPVNTTAPKSPAAQPDAGNAVDGPDFGN